MPVYGSAWETVKNLLNQFLDWLTGPPDPPDPPPSRSKDV